MADPHWTSYVGMITGVSGAIMGFISYRRSARLKTLDLRLELRKAMNELHQQHKQVSDLIAYANGSRKAVAAAMDNLRSGRMKLWEEAVEADKDRLNKLKEGLPIAGETFAGLKAEELESRLVDIHNKQCEVNSLLNKYKAEVESDDEARRHIRDTHGG